MPPSLVEEDVTNRREMSPISQRSRSELDFGSTFTSTGTSSELLIFNSRTLIPGNIYIVNLTVAHKGQCGSLFQLHFASLLVAVIIALQK